MGFGRFRDIAKLEKRSEKFRQSRILAWMLSCREVLHSVHSRKTNVTVSETHVRQFCLDVQCRYTDIQELSCHQHVGHHPRKMIRS